MTLGRRHALAVVLLGSFAADVLRAQEDSPPPGRRLGEVVVEAGKSVPGRRVDVLDANPLFLGGRASALLSDEGAPGDAEGADALIALDAIRHGRKGAVADGESRLLLRVRTDAPGTLSFSIAGRPGSGTIVAWRGGRTFQRAEDEHFAFAVWTPPEDFRNGEPEERGGLGIRGEAVFRRVEVAIRDAARPEVAFPATTLFLLRPPVVLVHGTYDNAYDCWAWGEEDLYWKASPPEYRTESFKRQLERRGFTVFLVNYQQSNGYDATFEGLPVPTEPLPERPLAAVEVGNQEPDVRASHFRDNDRVVWESGRDPEDRGQGIQHAVTFFRDIGVAATQADVVGHSMGGVLARVYIRGTALPTGRPPAGCRHPHRQDPEDWYRRADNFRKGDVNRLITIGSTHRGSHIPGLLRHYPRLGGFGAGTSAAWGIGNWFVAGQFAPGAFTDQIPGSPALVALGETRVPCHAIAGVSLEEDLADFSALPDGQPSGQYHVRLNKIWFRMTPNFFVVPLFSELLGQPRDAHDLMQMITLRHASGVIPPEMSRRELLRFWAAAFGNDWNDCTTSLRSALGGLQPGPHATIYPADYKTAKKGVLHGYEPRHREVQRIVFELLEGGLERFATHFPPSFELPPYEPDHPEAFKPHLR